MNNDYILSCESTVDLPYSYVSGRNIPVVFYKYAVDGVSYEDNMERDPKETERFYNFIADGKIPSTSQLNVSDYLDFLEPLLQKGDVLHLVFGSGMTKSIQNANIAAEELREKYPNRKLEVIDTYCSCGGYGLLLKNVADKRDEGLSFDELKEYVLHTSPYVHHQFYNPSMDYFKRSGRVSGVAATVATVLGICPAMRLDITGHMIAYAKVRGQKGSMDEVVRSMQEYAVNGTAYDGEVFINHANCPESAELMKEEILKVFPKAKITIYTIGTIIASHCGPGTISVYFFGKVKRPE